MQTVTNGNERRMSLGAVTKGKIAKPLRIVMYGVEGCGKSTFAGDAPSPIFIGAEDGTAHLDVARFPEPRSWTDVLAALDELLTAEHSYKTLAIDTLDWLEPRCWAHVCATRVDKNGKKHSNIENFPYGNGYALALDTWRDLLVKVDALRDRRGMTAILIAHSHVRTFKNPTDDDYERYQLKVHDKAAGLIKEWADCVFFAQHETLTHKQNNRSKGISTGARVIYTERRAAWDAKNRQGLPESFPLRWDAFEEARAGGADRLRARIVTLLEGQPANLATLVNGEVSKAGDDVARLAKIEGRLAEKVSATAKEEQGQ